MSPNERTQIFRAQKKRYRLIKKIAQGPISNVWRARDTLTGRDVVLKDSRRRALLTPSRVVG